MKLMFVFRFTDFDARNNHGPSYEVRGDNYKRTKMDLQSRGEYDMRRESARHGGHDRDDRRNSGAGGSSSGGGGASGGGVGRAIRTDNSCVCIYTLTKKRFKRDLRKKFLSLGSYTSVGPKSVVLPLRA